MDITLHRGAKEVGGTCLEVHAGSTRLIVDLGMPLSQDLRAPYGQLKAGGVLPDIDGLFDPGQGPEAILLSHAHADHTGLVRHTQSKIPIYMTQGTSKMLLAASLFAGQRGPSPERQRILKPWTSSRIGDIHVTPLSVDHSAFDSVALLLESGGRRILYSGDLRLHGRKPGMAKRLLAVARREPLDVLLLEGTHMGSAKRDGVSEAQLESAIVKELRETSGLALAAFSPLNVDRLVTFYRAARRTGRIFVVDPYAGFVLHLIASQCKVPRPSGSSGLRVVYPPGLKAPDKIQRLFRGAEVAIDDVLAKPERHLLLFREKLLDGRYPPGSALFYAYWQGYLKQPRGRELTERLKKAGVRLVLAHASGHIHLASMKAFIQELAPRILIPIHTFHPNAFRDLWPTVTLLKDGERWSL